MLSFHGELESGADLNSEEEQTAPPLENQSSVLQSGARLDAEEEQAVPLLEIQSLVSSNAAEGSDVQRKWKYNK